MPGKGWAEQADAAARIRSASATFALHLPAVPRSLAPPMEWPGHRRRSRAEPARPAVDGRAHRLFTEDAARFGGEVPSVRANVRGWVRARCALRPSGDNTPHCPLTCLAMLDLLKAAEVA